MTALRVAFLLIISLVTASARGGDFNNWVTIPMPSDLTVAPTSRGTTAAFQTTSAMHLFSGITKQWTTLPVANVDFFEQYHSYIIVLDGTHLHGFSARTGVVESVTVSPSVTLYNGPINSSWVTIAIDGTQAYAFSGFRGKWVPLTLSAPNPSVVATGLCGVIRDGSTLHGFGAHQGFFQSVAADAQASLAATVEVATAHSPTVFRAFSAQHNTWLTAPVASTLGAQIRNSLAFLIQGTQILAYSGLTGTLASYTAQQPIGGVNAETAVIGLVDGSNAVCYGAGRGAFAVLPLSNPVPPILVTDDEFVIVRHNGLNTPFSSLLGAFGPALSGDFEILTNDVIGFADGATTDYAYSPLLNDWFQAPPVTQFGAPALVRSAIALPHTGGYLAFSARHGEWVNQPTTLLGNYQAKPNGGTFLAIDGTNLAHVFDARLGRFESVGGPLPIQFDTFRNTAIGFDTQKAYGFGQPTGRWDEVTLHSPVTAVEVKTSIAVLQTATDIHVYSAKGSLSQEGRFPEFFLAIQLGNTLRLAQVGPPGSALMMLVGAKPTHQLVNLLTGYLDIDPNFLTIFPLGQTIGPSGLLEIDLPLPQSPVLVGIQPQIQNVVLPPTGDLYLSTSVSPVLY